MKRTHIISRKLFYCYLVLMFTVTSSYAKDKSQKVTSPDGKIVCKLSTLQGAISTGILQYSVEYNGKEIIMPSPFRLSFKEDVFVKNLIVDKIEKTKITNSWENRLGERKQVPDNYTQLTIKFKSGNDGLNFICRAYNEGVSFAYEIPGLKGKDTVTISDEDFSFRFKENFPCWATYTAQGIYQKVPISQIKNGCERPLVVECDSNLYVALAEAQLIDYARMKFGPDPTASNAVRSVLHGAVVKKVPFQSPWRFIMIAESPGKLLEHNYLIQNLNAPTAISDLSWIKPGKVIRDGTLTTKGGKACIDFVSNHGMQYIEFDAGWYGPENDFASDASKVNLDVKRSKGPLDLKEVIQYGKEKNIGVILYVNRRALEQQLDTLLPLYQKWGVAGIKYGFVQVGDQKYTKWLHEAVKKTSEYHLIVDIHDEYRPTGFSRTYPNLLSQEGIRGDEESIPNSHTLTTMFTRMLAGAADNTVCYYADRVTSQMGSHASQLAKAVCLFSPLQFLYWYDIPPQAPEKQDGLWGKTNMIGNEPELEFFDNIPTVWEQTKVLYGKIGEYALIARKNTDNWFIGGINGEKSNSLTIKFDFLEPGKNYKAKIYSDDPTVNTRTHVRIDEILVNSQSEYKVDLAANNGIAMQLTSIEKK